MLPTDGKGYPLQRMPGGPVSPMQNVGQRSRESAATEGLRP
jgi:hypothetical protein